VYVLGLCWDERALTEQTILPPIAKLQTALITFTCQERRQIELQRNDMFINNAYDNIRH
jgi:hypothetical protein